MKTSVRAILLLVTVLASFGAGFFTSQAVGSHQFESIQYTTLLTSTRWRLGVLDALDSNDPQGIRPSLNRALQADRAELESFRSDGKLGADGEELLKKIFARSEKTK